MVALAFGAVLLLAGAAFFATTHQADTPRTHSEEADPFASLASLSEPVMAMEAGAGASASEEAHAAALAEFQGALDNATAQLAAAAAALGSLDEDAAPIQSVLAGVTSRPWPMPSPAGGLSSAPGSMFDYVPGAGIATEPSAIDPPPTGKEEADAALADAATAFAQAKAVWQSPEVQAVFATLDDTPVGTPATARDPFGTQDTVEPDEEVAVLAKNHADEVLGTVGTGYSQLGSALDQMMEVQLGLAADVEAALASADAFEAQATADADAELQQRLHALEAAAQNYRDDVQLAAAAYVQAVLDARDGALATLDAAEADAGARIDAAAAAARTDTERAAAEFQSRIDARTSEIEAHEAAANAVFERRAAAGADTSLDLQSYSAAVLKSKADLRAQTAQAQTAAGERVATIEAAAEAAKAALEADAALARAAIEGHAFEALALADAREAELLFDVDGELAAALAKQTSLHEKVQGAIATSADTHRAQVLRDAHGIVRDARDHATSVLGAVELVQGATLSGVGVDLETIGKVAEDYGAVPAGERKERADNWTHVHGLLARALDHVLLDGQVVADKAAGLLVAAEAASAALARP